MARTKKVKEEGEVVVTPARRDEGSVTVVYRGIQRVYTREIHGENYADLAMEFAKKVGGILV